MAIATINPKHVMIFDRGTQPVRLKQIKVGQNTLSNTAFDPLMTKNFGKLPGSVRRTLTTSGVSTSTFLAKEEDGKPVGRKITGSDGEYTVTLIVPENVVAICSGLTGIGVVVDLTPDNFKLTLSNGFRTAVIEVKKEDIRLLELVRSHEWGTVDNSTLMIPATKVLVNGEWEPTAEIGEIPERYFNVAKEARVGLVVRHCIGGGGAGDSNEKYEIGIDRISESRGLVGLKTTGPE
ncbi:MAG: hypothetical protein ABIG39_04465 [Candidatus Micrarchaeota archaeon]